MPGTILPVIDGSIRGAGPPVRREFDVEQPMSALVWGGARRPGAGHAGQSDQPKALAELIGAFIGG